MDGARVSNDISDDEGKSHLLVNDSDNEDLPMKVKIHQTFENPHFSKLAMFINLFVLFLIISSTLTLMFSTIVAWNNTPEERAAWFLVECIIIGLFTVEYVIRVATAPDIPSYVVQPLNIVDLVAILPFYLQLLLLAVLEDDVNLSALAVLRVLRLVRLGRLMKVSKGSSQVSMFADALGRSRGGIALLCVLLLLADILFATCVYYAETAYCELQNETWVYKSFDEGSPTAYQNIPVSMWWGVVTMTTVGYGDESPITPLGKMVGVATMVSGLIVLAFPITIIGSSMSEVVEEFTEKQKAKALAKQVAQKVELKKQIALERKQKQTFKDLASRVYDLQAKLAIVRENVDAKEKELDTLKENEKELEGDYEEAVADLTAMADRH
eukprot:Lithocolla_globosa_v1_NODE_4556_length_1410_cov_24.832472.p1 type:complete len:383 gc:universal NODE_4556_length_1410_cov_24.832472:79-1227(+)